MNPLTTQAIVTSAWWILPNIGMARMHLLSCIWTFHHPSPQCYAVPTLPERKRPSSEESSRSEEEVDIKDSDYNFRDAASERNPYYPNQRDLNDLIRDLDLTKLNAELLTSRLKKWDLFDESVQVTGQRKCYQHFSSFFTH
ncbi:uncharacterized protein LOC143255990 [Tachypleus tridentatus]|uniref:uncharacterized protein LOC143255990 n=1 Tax=Tachypleus tridentatus TaxID=6853 RepID=UPI003FD5925A